MAEESKNMPVTTFIALGAIVGLFVVFNDWRDGNMDKPPEPTRLEPTTEQQRLSIPGGASEKAPETRTQAQANARPFLGQLWQQDHPGVYCLNADCSTVRLSPGASHPCDSGMCVAESEGMVCIEGNCQTYSDIQSRVDYPPATKRITDRIKEAVIYDGETAEQAVSLELMMDDQGNIYRLTVVSSSGNSNFDSSVRYAALDASPFSEIRGIQPHTRSLLQLIHVQIDP
tara:strand:+ start:4193 stop:4879 length:687 start_codon:yes stop_codon:yes gene_type:complete